MNKRDSYREHGQTGTELRSLAYLTTTLQQSKRLFPN